MEATSSISAGRPMGMTLTNFAASAGLLLVIAIICGVFTAQGATVLTVMPSLANSRAIPVVRPCTPPLAALYAAWSHNPLRTESAPRLMMRPYPWARIFGTAYQEHHSTVHRLRSMVVFSVSGECSANALMMPPPALLTRMSSLPKRSVARLIVFSAVPCSERSPAWLATSAPNSIFRCADASFSPASSRSASTSLAPSLASRSAIASPMPFAAPVTMATLLSSFLSITANSSEDDTDPSLGAQPFAVEQAALFLDAETAVIGDEAITVAAEIGVGHAVLGAVGDE